MKNNNLLIICFLFCSKIFLSQEHVKEKYYNEYGIAISGIHILGDWIENYSFTNVAQMTGVGISGINIINLKYEKISFKNSIKLNFARNSYTMDNNRYGLEYNKEAKEKSAIYSNTYLLMLGSQVEYNFLEDNIYKDIDYKIKANPYLGFGGGLAGYYSKLDSYLSIKNVPDILKYEENLNPKKGITYYFNVSLGVRFNIFKRNIIYMQLSYYYMGSDNIDWIKKGAGNDYIQELQIGYTYVL